MTFGAVLPEYYGPGGGVFVALACANFDMENGFFGLVDTPREPSQGVARELQQRNGACGGSLGSRSPMCLLDEAVDAIRGCPRV